MHELHQNRLRAVKGGPHIAQARHRAFVLVVKAALFCALTINALTMGGRRMHHGGKHNHAAG